MVCAPNKRLKQRGLRPLDSQQVARRLGDSYRLSMRFVNLSVFLLAVTLPAFGQIKCDESVQILQSGEDDRFSIAKKSEHTDWVKMRFTVEVSGSASDIKPVDYSTDRYINRAYLRIKNIKLSTPAKHCFKDLILYQRVEHAAGL